MYNDLLETASAKIESLNEAIEVRELRIANLESELKRKNGYITMVEGKLIEKERILKGALEENASREIAINTNRKRSKETLEAAEKKLPKGQCLVNRSSRIASSAVYDRAIEIVSSCTNTDTKNRQKVIELRTVLDSTDLSAYASNSRLPILLSAPGYRRMLVSMLEKSAEKATEVFEEEVIEDSVSARLSAAEARLFALVNK